MFTAFLIGLLAVVAIIVTVVVAVIGGKWLKEYVAKKLKNREKINFSLLFFYFSKN